VTVRSRDAALKPTGMYSRRVTSAAPAMRQTLNQKRAAALLTPS